MSNPNRVPRGVSQGGQFAQSTRSESGVSLGVSEEINPQVAYETNRRAINDATAAYTDVQNDSTRFNLGMAAVAFNSTLRSDEVYDRLGDHEQGLVDTLGDAVDAHVEAPDDETSRRLADAAADAMTAADLSVRTYDGKNAIEWYGEANAARRRAHDSFERSDTDGFMSQAASETMALQYEASARLAEQGGMAEFPALMDTDGNLVPARLVRTHYGQAWMLLDEKGDSTGEWVNPSRASTAAKRNAAMAKKGYAEGLVRAPAKVTLSEGLRPHPILVRTDSGFNADAEVTAAADSDD